jgi:hypothetical protein
MVGPTPAFLQPAARASERAGPITGARNRSCALPIGLCRASYCSPGVVRRCSCDEISYDIIAASLSCVHVAEASSERASEHSEYLRV